MSTITYLQVQLTTLWLSCISGLTASCCLVASTASLAFLHICNLHGEHTRILVDPPTELVPVPCFGMLVDTYVNIQGFTTNDLWLIYDLYTSSRFASSL